MASLHRHRRLLFLFFLFLSSYTALSPSPSSVASSPPDNPPASFQLSLPPFSNSTMACSFDPSINAGKVEPMPICVQSYPTPGAYVYLCDDDEPVSARYQYRHKVQLWKRGSKYAASFSTQFTLEVSRDSESEKEGFFGAGLAFAITPTLDVGGSGAGSLGLFAIDAKTGRRSAAAAAPKTVAVEIDLDRDSDSWDRPAPHVGLDLNSLRSAAAAPLWDDLANRKFTVFVDYDAASFLLSVRFQNLSSSSSSSSSTPSSPPDRRKSKLLLSYPNLDLSRYVDELSYVGFSSRVPVTTDGVYFIYDWKFSTKWVVKRRTASK